MTTTVVYLIFSLLILYPCISIYVLYVNEAEDLDHPCNRRLNGKFYSNINLHGREKSWLFRMMYPLMVFERFFFVVIPLLPIRGSQQIQVLIAQKMIIIIA